MIEEHPLFNLPTKLDHKIWRYIDFTKFIELLNSETLFFSRSDKFEDIFEGSLPSKAAGDRNRVTAELIKQKQLLTKYTAEYMQNEAQKNREDFAINCWHLNEHESAAMWRLYLKSNEGIAIQSTFNRLKATLHEKTHRIFLGEVNYIDYDNDTIDWANVISPFVYKRKSFSHEKELRAIIWKPLLSKSELGDFSESGIKIKVDLRVLIENIFVSPDSPGWLTNLITDSSKKFGFNFNVTNSRLSDKPIF